MDVSSSRAIAIPNAAQGLHVLLVDHNTSCLMHMASMLEEQSYKVTTTELASIALCLIREGESSYDLVIAEMDMPEMDGFILLNQVLLIKEDISVILMSSNGDSSMAKRALNEGACFFLFKPVRTQELIKVWQHVFHKRGQRTNFPNVVEDFDANHQDNVQLGFVRDPIKGKAPICFDEVQESKRRKNLVEENVAKKHKLILGGEGKRVNRDEDVGKRKNVEKGKKKKKDYEDNCSPPKRKRMTWTAELHQEFVQAIGRLGEDTNAHPKAILREMDIPGLTHRHIASHLQKYRQQINKIREQLLKDPPIFESMMIGKPSYLPQSMMMKKTIPIFESMMMTKPTQPFQSLTTSSSGPFGFANPQTYLNRGTAYYQMDTLKKLFSDPTTNNNLPKTNNYQSSYTYANFGNQEFPKLNHVVPNSADQKGKQVVPSFGGYNDNNDAPTDNLGMDNIDALIEAWAKELADALGSDANLHQEMEALAKYNNVVAPQNLQQEPSKELSAACEALAPAETEFNMGEQNYSYEDLAMILDDSYGGSGDIIGTSSQPPEEPLANNVDDDDITKLFDNEDFSELFDIFPDRDDGSL